ncbi:MAG: hypothetical protein EAZ15_07470 [Sphingobacteriales bacterium]|nr:MAG: hypothetical protein EAZ15_07470 [Sphingobacteriales bacterium]
MKIIIIKMKFIILILTLLNTCLVVNGQSNSYNITTNKGSEQNTESDIKSELASHFPYINPADWQAGMKFMTEPIQDKSFDMNWDIGLIPYKSKDPYNKIKQSNFQWKTFVFEFLEERKVKCPRGTCVRTYLIFSCEGKKYEHEFIGDITELRNSKVLNTINKLVYLDEVDYLKTNILGKILFIKTSRWMHDDDGKSKYSIETSKLIPVKIINIGLGTQYNPSKVVFKQLDSEKENYLNIYISGINNDSGAFGNSFDDTFQFKDPKLDYPTISDVIWKVIQKEKVKIGMNKKECILSWGQPNTINKTITGNDILEQWVYGSNSYLYFNHGVIETIQD